VSDSRAVTDRQRERGGEDVGGLGRHHADYNHAGLTRQGLLGSMSHGTGRLMSRGDVKPLADAYDFAALRRRILNPDSIADASFRTEGPYAYGNGEDEPSGRKRTRALPRVGDRRGPLAPWAVLAPCSTHSGTRSPARYRMGGQG
jgi:hypothetical protein